MAKASHIALPAACATTPRIEKIPAPTIPPTPIETAAAMPIGAEPDFAGDTLVVAFMVAPAGRVSRQRVAFAAFRLANSFSPCGRAPPLNGTFACAAEGAHKRAAYAVCSLSPFGERVGVRGLSAALTHPNPLTHSSMLQQRAALSPPELGFTRVRHF